MIIDETWRSKNATLLFWVLQILCITMLGHSRLKLLQMCSLLVPTNKIHSKMVVPTDTNMFLFCNGQTLFRGHPVTYNPGFGVYSNLVVDSVFLMNRP